MRERRAAAHSETIAKLSSHARHSKLAAGCVTLLLLVCGLDRTPPLHWLPTLAVLCTTWLLVVSVPFGALARRLSLMGRYLRVVLLFVRVVSEYKYTSRVRSVRAERADATWAAFHEWLGALLHREISALGGLWLKVGQYVASRSDIVPDQVVAHLSRLLDRNPPRPLAQTHDTLLAEWGVNADTCLESLEPHALSCGSIAQVHVGWLRREGARLRSRWPSRCSTATLLPCSGRTSGNATC